MKYKREEKKNIFNILESQTNIGDPTTRYQREHYVVPDQNHTLHAYNQLLRHAFTFT